MIRKVGAIAAVAFLGFSAPAWAAEAKMTKCHITYSLKGWAVLYESASGNGTIECDNGQKAKVSLKSKGGGIAFGKATVVDGKGAFSDVANISELYGHYVAMDADAGEGKEADSQVMSKGKISLALAGKGKGMEVGVTFGDFDIEPVK